MAGCNPIISTVTTIIGTLNPIIRPVTTIIGTLNTIIRPVTANIRGTDLYHDYQYPYREYPWYGPVPRLSVLLTRLSASVTQEAIQRWLAEQGNVCPVTLEPLVPTAATSAPGLGSPRPHLRRGWAHPAYICAGTGLTPPTSAPGPPHCARRCRRPSSSRRSPRSPSASPSGRCAGAPG